MTNAKSTKRALLTSIFAILMCVAMLAGTTFAWFTDTASTGVNKIQAGNLDVDIVGANSDTHVEKLNFTKAAGATNEEILWEPGCRYLTEGFRIANKGNLALKWKVQVNKGTTAANDGNYDLLDVIDFYLVTDTDDEGTLLDEFSGNLEKSKTSDVYYIKGVMQTTAGNEYQNLTLDGITITVYATQDTVESDSFDNQYDKDAKYTEVIAAGKSFSGGKYTLTTGVTATNAGAIAVTARQGAEVTIEDGTFDGGSGGNNVCVYAHSSTVIIKDGYFTVGGDANGIGNAVIESYDGNITIEGGFFKTDYQYDGKYYVLNQNNSHPGTITVKGGTFVNYDPSKGDDNLGGNFVADGYSVISETQANGDVWYTVVEDTVVNSNEEFATALATATAVSKIILNCDITELNLTDAEIAAITGTIYIDGQGEYGIKNSVVNNIPGAYDTIKIQNVVIIG